MMICPNWREVESLRFAHSIHKDSKHEVVIVGAGPVGLTLAIDLAMRGVSTIVLEKLDRVSEGSRAICWSRRTLDIFNQIGIAAAMQSEGVQWKIGRVYHKETEIFSQTLTPETFQESPFFVNFQQSLCEYLLLQECKKYPQIDIRWANEVIDLTVEQNQTRLLVRCDDKDYTITTKYLLACDGVRSLIRHKLNLLNLPFKKKYLNDRFLIVDIEMNNDFPTERRFWFEPSFHEGQSTLLHKQPQNIWRIDFQLDSGENKTSKELELEKDEKIVRKRIQAFLGNDNIEFDIVWCSVYRFTCRRLEQFSLYNVFFVGDSAHVVSPFGARGGNGGIQDANNIAWKIAEVVHGRADSTLLQSYNQERAPASDENITKSSQTIDFMSPQSKKIKSIRDTVLNLASEHPFATGLVNCGRMSEAFSYRNIGMFEHHNGIYPCIVQVSDVAIDVPIQNSQTWQSDFLLQHINDYTILAYNRQPLEDNPAFKTLCINNLLFGENIWHDKKKLFKKYYIGDEGGYVLFRPDQHILGIWTAETPDKAIEKISQFRKI